MPYKAKSNWVLVKKAGRWVKFKKHETPKKAKAHATALNTNIRHK